MTQRSAQPQSVGQPGAQERGKVEGRTQRQIIWRNFRRHRLAVVSFFILVVLYALALAAPFISPYGFEEIDFTALGEAPSLDHPMGTDILGRDELTRVLYGGRVSLIVGVCVGVLATLIGTTIGLISGLFARYVDLAAMGVVDFMFTLPFLPVLLVVGSIFNLTAPTIALVLSLFVWPTIARLVRGQVLSLREQEYVQAARAIGVSSFRIMSRHLLPNVVGVMVVEATLLTGQAILAESVLSFLGFGIQPPTPSWGNLAADSQESITQQPWLAIFPGIMIMTTCLCINFLGDGLRDALDPRATGGESGGEEQGDTFAETMTAGQ